jgi:serine phosphatase RsbU (regulator of sigma subunit)
MLRELLARRPAKPLDRPAAAGTAVAPAQAMRRLSSLRRRLLVLLSLVLVPWLALVLYTTADERDVAIERVGNDAMRLVHIVTSNQAAQVEAARQLLTAFARMPQVRTRNPAECAAFMAQMLNAYPSYLNIGRAERDGSLTCSAMPMPAPVNVADRMYFAHAIESRRFTIGEYQIGRITQLPSIAYGYPLVDAAGDVEAVVFAAQGLEWLTLALADVDLPEGAVLVVIDRKGTVLARLPQAPGFVGRTLPEPELLAKLSGRDERGLFEADDARGVRRLWAHAPLISGHQLHAAIGVPESVAFADIKRRLVRNLAALALVTLVAFAAATLGAAFILRQIDALVAATRRLASGDLGARAPLAGRSSEIEILAGAFNSMAATLEARDRELRAAEEKSRAAEVQLAVTRAQIDIARQIQQSLLPEDPLSLAGVRFAGRCIPAVAVGGDYFGYFPRGESAIDSLIGDVSGHGVGAALLMAEARTTFMTERLVAHSASAMLAKINDLLHDDLDRAGLFMTACCATFDAASRELGYASAGHPPALLLRANESSCSELVTDGMLFGIERGAQFAELRLQLGTGDIVVFYTDGITEMHDGADDLFGARRLGDVVVANRAEDPEAMIAAVLARLDAFAEGRPYEDDCTIVVMKVTE